MKYFLDQEFIEGIRKPIRWLPTIGNFNKPYHFIDLVSIGLVCEDGREYYAISNEFDPRYADDWVIKNVIKPIYDEDEQKHYNIAKHIPGLCYSYREYTHKRLGKNLKYIGKPNNQIKEEITDFVYYGVFRDHKGNYVSAQDGSGISFYGYYADYDWVLFCSLWGKMISLPKGFPMYCIDLKQILDEVQKKEDDLNDSVMSVRGSVKEYSSYPQQENEHNALDDAKWNLQLYNFLKSFGV